MSEDKYGLFGMILFLFTLIIALLVAQDRDELKQEAVNRGYAEWIVIGQNKTEFKWKEKQ